MAAEEPTVIVTFNGQDTVISYNPHAAVQGLLDHAKQAFQVQSSHLLSLFTEGGVELKDAESAQVAGVKPGELLVLRQSTVKGGK